MSRRSYPPILFALLTLVPAMSPTRIASASDHSDGNFASLDRGADITDLFLFLDPNDNSRVILAFATHGFIPPAENANLGPFDSSVRYRFQIENTGDAQGDAFLDVAFSMQTSRAAPQTAMITLPGGRMFTAPTTVASSTGSSAPPPVVTTDLATSVSFFAGLRDDPFFFDVPAELLYRASRISGVPDPTIFERARDTFAGYNVNMIVLSVPATMLRGRAGNSIGVAVYAQRASKTFRFDDSDPRNSGPFRNVDRLGIPLANTLLIPFTRKNEYNRAMTTDDAAGKFGADVVASLQELHTDAARIDRFLQLAVTNGDMLRLDTSIANTGIGGGTNLQAGFPNGRRPADDTIDIIVTIVNNGVPQGDNVNANDVPFRDTFPFFADPTQPFPAGTVDDRTRN